MANGTAFEFVQYKYDKRRQDEAQVEENKAKKAKQQVEADVFKRSNVQAKTASKEIGVA